jgi:hypothetical protein
MNHSPSLTSVVKQFTSWREASGKGKQTPPPLKQQAIALIPHYPIGQIINALSINHRTIKRWSVQSEAPQSAAFVSLPALLPDNEIATPQLLTTCEFPNGIQLKLTKENLTSELLSLLYQLTPENTI